MLKQKKTISAFFPHDQIMVLAGRGRVRNLARAKHIVTLYANHAHWLTFAMGKADPPTNEGACKYHECGKQA
jgi:hypothetical protein